MSDFDVKYETDAMFRKVANTVATLLFFLALPFNVALRGWTLYCLWTWFLTQATGIDSPSPMLCDGLSMFVTCVGYRKVEFKEDETRFNRAMRATLEPFLYNLTALGLGYAIHLVEVYTR